MATKLSTFADRHMSLLGPQQAVPQSVFISFIEELEEVLSAESES